MSAPDWARLGRIGDEMTALVDAGHWTREAFERLYGEATEASPDWPQYRSFLARRADPSWLK